MLQIDQHFVERLIDFIAPKVVSGIGRKTCYKSNNMLQFVYKLKTNVKKEI